MLERSEKSTAVFQRIHFSWHCALVLVVPSIPQKCGSFINMDQGVKEECYSLKMKILHI